MNESNSYPNIDMVRTGAHLKKLIRQRGYSVKDIQKLLNLSCPQPIYRWFKGKILPSVDHLFLLSKLLYVHMEDLLLTKQEEIAFPEWSKMQKHLLKYWVKVQQTAA